MGRGWGSMAWTLLSVLQSRRGTGKQGGEIGRVWCGAGGGYLDRWTWT